MATTYYCWKCNGAPSYQPHERGICDRCWVLTKIKRAEARRDKAIEDIKRLANELVEMSQ